jgi:hypothetical protein
MNHLVYHSSKLRNKTYVHQVGYNKLIDIMMHGQRNIKILNNYFTETQDNRRENLKTWIA